MVVGLSKGTFMHMEVIGTRIAYFSSEFVLSTLLHVLHIMEGVLGCDEWSPNLDPPCDSCHEFPWLDNISGSKFGKVRSLICPTTLWVSVLRS